MSSGSDDLAAPDDGSGDMATPDEVAESISPQAVDLPDGIEGQVAMVMDLNKCVGCQTCTVACKTLWTEGGGTEYMYWNNVETKPGEGYPDGWEDSGGGWASAERDQRRVGEVPSMEDYGEPWVFDHETVLFDGSDDRLGPDDPTGGPNWDEDRGAGEYPNSYRFYLPRICNHCTHASCVEACPRSAVYKREEDGIVLIDQERCRGYRYCVEGCPYKKIYYNATSKMAEKCVFCYPRMEGEGPDDEQRAPACAEQCPPQLRFVGQMNDAEGPIYKLVHEWEVALPLHPEFQNEPNVYYVPPLSPNRHTQEDESVDVDRIPHGYLEQLFGEDVHEALATLKSERERVRSGERSELMELLTTNDRSELYRIEGFDYA